MLTRSLFLVVTSAWMLASVDGQLNRRHRRVRVAARRTNAEQASMFDIEDEVSCWSFRASPLTTFSIDP